MIVIHGGIHKFYGLDIVKYLFFETPRFAGFALQHRKRHQHQRDPATCIKRADINADRIYA
jgi:hypothetical protein